MNLTTNRTKPKRPKSKRYVARFVDLAVGNPAMRGETLEVSRPKNLIMEQVARVTGKSGKFGYVPLPIIRVIVVLLRPVKPMIVRQTQAGVVMGTRDMTFDVEGVAGRYSAGSRMSLAGMVRRNDGGVSWAVRPTAQADHLCRGPNYPGAGYPGCQGYAPCFINVSCIQLAGTLRERSLSAASKRSMFVGTRRRQGI